MNWIINKLKNVFTAQTEADVQAEIDKANLRNLFILSIVVSSLDLITIALFIAAAPRYDRQAITSLVSVVSCLVLCIVIMILTKYVQRNDCGHRAVAVLIVSFFIIMTIWSFVISVRHYLGNQQMLTFFAVILCTVCFLTVRPSASCIGVFAVYTALYLILWRLDRAESVNLFNYLFLAVLSAMGMIVRYFQQVRISVSALELRRTNDELMYISRHDILTGVRNRAAFVEDMETHLNVPIAVIMSDIDYFKSFNDTYGHVVGDQVISEVGRNIGLWFPNGCVYRYGGDEFLIVIDHPDERTFEEASQANRFLDMRVADKEFHIRISFGCSNGTAEDQEGLRMLITEADRRLYDVKKEVHMRDEILLTSADASDSYEG